MAWLTAANDPKNDPALASGGGGASVLDKPGPQMLNQEQAQNLGEPACAYKKCAPTHALAKEELKKRSEELNK